MFYSSLYSIPIPHSATTSEHETFQLVLKDSKEEGLIPIWTLLQPKINAIGESMESNLFNSAFTKEELQVLNLKANSDNFPMLTNRNEDLRPRVQKRYQC